MSRESQRPDRESIGAALVVLVFVLGYAAVGYSTLDPASRAVPSLAALVTACLLAVELVKARRRRAAVQAPAEARASEWLVIGSIVAAVGAILLVGFLVALPLYVTLAIWAIGRRPLAVALTTAALTTAAIYVAFELVLSYRLYAGVVF